MYLCTVLCIFRIDHHCNFIVCIIYIHLQPVDVYCISGLLQTSVSYLVSIHVPSMTESIIYHSSTLIPQLYIQHFVLVLYMCIEYN